MKKISKGSKLKDNASIAKSKATSNTTVPKDPPAHAAEASTSTIATASTPSTTPPLTDEQKADAIIAMLGTQTQGVRDKMVDKMFGDEEDFSEA